MVITAHEKLGQADVSEINHSFSGTGSDEDILTAESGKTLGLAYVLVSNATGASESFTLKDNGGSTVTVINTCNVPNNDIVTVSPPVPIALDGDLQAQVSATGLVLSAWAVQLG